MKWLTVAKKEIRSAFRDKLFFLLAGIIWVLLAVSLWNGYTSFETAKQQRTAAEKLFREEWDELETNPHSAAHFGTYLYKPFSVLTLIDNGLNNYTGTAYHVEAHKQHDVNYSTAQDTDSQLRFGELTVASVMQLLVPLLIIFLCFSGISREKEGGTLRMLRIQGIDQRSLLTGKIIGNYALVLMILFPFFILICTFIIPGQQQNGTLLRVAMLLLSYLIYFFILVAVVIFISAFSRSSPVALLANLSIWFILGIIMPRITSSLVENGLELPSRFELNRKISEGYTKGLDGDKGAIERYEDYKKEVMARYKADSVQQLPVNLDGLSMQYGEDYNSRVYKRFSGEVEQLILRQQRRLQYLGIINPFMAVQQLSMGASGTDYYHHLAFHHQARKYRDDFIRTLNMDLAINGTKSGYKAGNDLYRNMPAFNYRIPDIDTMVSWQRYPIAALTGWLAVVVLLLAFISNHMKILQ